MLVHFCNIDDDREIAIVTETGSRENRKMVGVARLLVDPDFRGGEFTVVVYDGHQGHGPGYKLVDMIIGVAQDKGLKRIYGTVLTGNRGMLRICERLGFSTAVNPGENTPQVELTLD